MTALCFSLTRNLQAAIGAYYDFESPNVNTPSMSFVEDVTIGEGESVPPDTPFTKTWRIQNTGTRPVMPAAGQTLRSSCATRASMPAGMTWALNVGGLCAALALTPDCAPQVRSRGRPASASSTSEGISSATSTRSW